MCRTGDAGRGASGSSPTVFFFIQPQSPTPISFVLLPKACTFSLAATASTPKTVADQAFAEISFVFSTATFAPTLTFYPVSEVSHFSPIVLVFSTVKSIPLSIPEIA